MPTKNNGFVYSSWMMKNPFARLPNVRLRSAGYEVAAASDGYEALRVVEAPALQPGVPHLHVLM